MGMDFKLWMMASAKGLDQSDQIMIILKSDQYFQLNKFISTVRLANGINVFQELTKLQFASDLD